MRDRSDSVAHFFCLIYIVQGWKFFFRVCQQV
jgi:hypothetical protein